ncbi:MAG: HAD hydrolase-like protein [Deltaproteobacteria bacterium]|nr:HAD hydrolase-like protein [Deltaproteobacteria bacterium]
MGEDARCLVLFDLDGTLVQGPPRARTAGYEAMCRAIETMSGQRDVAARVEFHGRTDRQISRGLLLAAGEPDPGRARIDQLLGHYVAFLAQGVTERPYRPIGSPREVFAALAACGATLGYGTGNVRRGAAIKLESAGLADLAPLERGGFGEDGDTRDEVLEVGARRCDPSRTLPVVVVGDTPHDVASAHAIGGRCVAVTTGKYGRRELEACGADAVVRTVDAALIEAILRTARRQVT